MMLVLMQMLLFYWKKRWIWRFKKRRKERYVFLFSPIFYGIVNNSHGMWVMTIKGQSNVFFFFHRCVFSESI